MDQIAVPVLFAVLIEAVVFYADQFAVNRNLDWKLISALVISMLACVAFQVDIFAESGFLSVIPFVGAAFTGIVFARVANFSHNVIQAVYLRSKYVGGADIEPA